MPQGHVPVWGTDLSGVPVVRILAPGSPQPLVYDSTSVYINGPTASVCERCGELMSEDSRILHAAVRECHDASHARV